MPKNNQQLIASYQDFENETAVAISPQSSGARFSQIPSGGTQVYLPPAVVDFGTDQPSDGDFFQLTQGLPGATTVDGASQTLVATGSTLTVKFHTGRTYDHPHVPYSVFEGLMQAESKGAYYNEHIRGRYS